MILFIDAKQNDDEKLTGKPFQSRGGRIFQDKLVKAGISPKDYEVIYLAGKDVCVLPLPKLVIVLGKLPLSSFIKNPKLSDYLYKFIHQADYTIGILPSIDAISKQSKKADVVLLDFLCKVKEYVQKI